MRAWWLLTLTLSCRYLAPAQPSWSPARPYEPAPAPTGLQNTAPPVGNRCGVECGAGFHCDEREARCVANEARAGTADGGPAWLP